LLIIRSEKIGWIGKSAGRVSPALGERKQLFG
jgi:hypothetical protein